MSVQIIADSTVDMPDRIKKRFRVVPLTVHFGDEEFIDGVTIDKARFYERLLHFRKYLKRSKKQETAPLL